MRVSRPTLRYAALNAAYWAGFCLALAFSSVFLLARGLTNAQVGAVLSVSGLVSAALQPVVAGRAGASRRPLRVWVAGLAVLVALAGAGLLVTRGPGASAVLFGVVIALIQVALPLVNAIGMAAARDGVPVDFGPARATGSFAFALTSVATGAFVARAGADVIPALTIVGQALLVVAALTFVFTGADAAASAPHPPDAATSDAAPLRDPLPEPPPLDRTRRRRLTLLLVGVTGCYVSHATINSFNFQIVQHHGGDASHLGLAFMIAAAIETLPMIFFRRIVARWNPAILLRAAAVGLAVKALATLLAPDLTAFLLTMLLQVASFALMIPASVYYIDRLLPAAERVRGQALMTLTLTLGTVVSGLGGGVLLDAAGVPALLAAGAAVGSAAVALVVAGTEPV